MIVEHSVVVTRLVHKSLPWVFLRQLLSAFYNSLDFTHSLEVNLLEKNALRELYRTKEGPCTRSQW